MITKVTNEGINIPRHWLENVREVEIRRENDLILIMPVHDDADPILLLGSAPASTTERDASVNHDQYLYKGD